MRKKILSFFFLILLLSSSFGFFYTPRVNAEGIWDCTRKDYQPRNITTDTKVINKLVIDVKGQVNINQQSGNNPYWIYLRRLGNDLYNAHRIKVLPKITGNGDQWTFTIDENFDRDGNSDKESQHEGPFEEGEYAFNLGTETADQGFCKVRPRIEVRKSRVENPDKCTFSFPPDNSLKPGQNLNLKVIFNDAQMRGGASEKHEIQIRDSQNNNLHAEFLDDNGPTTAQLESENGFPIGSLTGGINYILTVTSFNVNRCSTEFDVDINGGQIGCSGDDRKCTNNPNGDFCIFNARAGNFHCDSYPTSSISNPCQPGSGKAIPSSCKTAIGRIAIDPGGFMKSVLILVLSLGGGILLVFLIINGYKLMISQGDPEKIKEARESIVSAVAGLLFIIFSIAILQLITVDILGLPGFR